MKGGCSTTLFFEGPGPPLMRLGPSPSTYSCLNFNFFLIFLIIIINLHVRKIVLIYFQFFSFLFGFLKASFIYYYIILCYACCYCRVVDFIFCIFFCFAIENVC